MIRAIFFDFDGVIVESVDIKTNTFSRLFQHEGRDITRKIVDYHLKNTGVSRFEKFKFIYKYILNRRLSDAEFNILCEKFSALTLEEVIKAPYVKGAKEFLENYASKYKCFILSATPQEEIEKIIQKRQMSCFFKAIYGAPNKKSDAVKDILIKEEIAPINALYVGDAMSDYIAAKENCVNFIARINNNESIFSDIACLKIKDLSGFDTIVEKL